MLIEYSSRQLLKVEPSPAASELPLGIQFLLKLASRSAASNIPLHLLTDFISEKLLSVSDFVHLKDPDFCA